MRTTYPVALSGFARKTAERASDFAGVVGNLIRDLATATGRTARDAWPAAATGATGRETPVACRSTYSSRRDKRANVAWPSRAAVRNQASVALTAFRR